MCFQSLGRDDPLEKEMKTYASILVWEISWTEEPCGLQSRQSDRSQRLNNNNKANKMKFPNYYYVY